ncbi:MAG: hypothetical protein ABII00_16545 [Elusimicrobiota bacterium]
MAYRWQAAPEAKPGKPMPFIRDEFLERLARERRVQEGIRELPYTRTTIREDDDIPARGDGAVFIGGGSYLPVAIGSTGTHNRDQGGRPADPGSPPGSSSGKGKGKDKK